MNLFFDSNLCRLVLAFSLLHFLNFLLAGHVLHADEHKQTEADHDAHRRLEQAFYIKRRSDLEVLFLACSSHGSQVSDWISLAAGDIVAEIVY